MLCCVAQCRPLVVNHLIPYHPSLPVLSRSTLVTPLPHPRVGVSLPLRPASTGTPSSSFSANRRLTVSYFSSINYPGRPRPDDLSVSCPPMMRRNVAIRLITAMGPFSPSLRAGLERPAVSFLASFSEHKSVLESVFAPSGIPACLFELSEGFKHLSDASDLLTSSVSRSIRAPLVVSERLVSEFLGDGRPSMSLSIPYCLRCDQGKFRTMRYRIFSQYHAELVAQVSSRPISYIERRANPSFSVLH